MAEKPTLNLTTLIHPGANNANVTKDWVHIIDIELTEANLEMTWKDFVLRQCKQMNIELIKNFKVVLMDYKKYQAYHRDINTLESEKGSLYLEGTHKRKWKNMIGHPDCLDVKNMTLQTVICDCIRTKDIQYNVPKAFVLLIEKCRTRRKKKNQITTSKKRKKQQLQSGAKRVKSAEDEITVDQENVSMSYGQQYQSAYESLSSKLQSSPLNNRAGKTNRSITNTLLDKEHYLDGSQLKDNIHECNVAVFDNLAAKKTIVCCIYMRISEDNQEKDVFLGTGFMISDKHMMTCFHVFFKTKDVGYAEYYKQHTGTFYAYFAASNTEVPIGNTPNYVYPEKPMEQSKLGFDVAVIELSESLNFVTSQNCVRLDFNGTDTQPLLVNPIHIRDEHRQRVYIIGYRSLDEKQNIKITMNNNIILGFENWHIFYSNHTWPGLSGAPCFDVNGSFVGMHRMSGQATSCYTSESGLNQWYQYEVFFNCGLRADLFIADTFSVNCTDPIAKRAATARLKLQYIKYIKQFYGSGMES